MENCGDRGRIWFCNGVPQVEVGPYPSDYSGRGAVDVSFSDMGIPGTRGLVLELLNGVGISDVVGKAVKVIDERVHKIYIYSPEDVHLNLGASKGTMYVPN